MEVEKIAGIRVATPWSAERVVDFRWAGVLRAAAVLSAWTSLHFALLFLLQLQTLPPLVATAVVLLAVPLLSFLNVGLFITAHDAMHGVLAPRRPQLNEWIGASALFLYGFFSYTQLKKAHLAHHHAPATPDDPDFHASDDNERFWPWYGRFMWSYLTWRQWVGMPILFWSLYFAGAPLVNILAFWAAPSLLSTLQLFYFGTYLPHKTPAGRHTDAHRATTNGYSLWWSFLSCYHFGKHWEHHEYPYAPWWKLGRLSVSEPRTIRTRPLVTVVETEQMA